MLDNPKTIWTLLAELVKRENKLEFNTRSDQGRLRKKIKDRFAPIQSTLLETTDNYSFPKRLYLHLPPNDKGGQPILRVSFEKQDGYPVFRFEVAILLKYKESFSDEIDYKAIGVRFESPEGPEGTSDHDYYHAQWFSSFRGDDAILDGCPDWLPDTHPAIEIAAENAVDILCCALKSLYGSRNSEPLQWLAEKAKGDRTMGTETKKRIGRWVGTA